MYTNKIGEIIAQKRKEAGLTQAEVAEYVGVSKPAVSKWESGHSLPDIALLPELASFFDISIDELMGYQPQMNEKNINNLYETLVDSLSKKHADEVFAECRYYIKRYYFCWPLILKMSAFLYNHYTLSSDPKEVIEEILTYTERIEQYCDDLQVIKGAKYIRTCCFIQLGDYTEAEASAEQLIEPVLNAPVLLSYIYQAQGKSQESQQVILSYIDQNLELIFTAFSNVCAYPDTENAEKLLYTFSALLTLFEAEKYYPAHLLRYYWAAAFVCCKSGKNEKALKHIEEFMGLFEKVRKDSKRYTNGYFGVECHPSTKTQFSENRFNFKMILETALTYFLEDSAFDSLRENEAYEEVLQTLTKWTEEYHGES